MNLNWKTMSINGRLEHIQKEKKMKTETIDIWFLFFNELFICRTRIANPVREAHYPSRDLLYATMRSSRVQTEITSILAKVK